MDWLDALLKIGATFVPIVAALGYQQYQIRGIQEEFKKMVTAEAVQKQIDLHMEYIKEKIEDNFAPIQAQLDRVESRLDNLADKMDK